MAFLPLNFYHIRGLLLLLIPPFYIYGFALRVAKVRAFYKSMGILTVLHQWKNVCFISNDRLPIYSREGVSENLVKSLPIPNARRAGKILYFLWAAMPSMEAASSNTPFLKKATLQSHAPLSESGLNRLEIPLSCLILSFR